MARRVCIPAGRHEVSIVFSERSDGDFMVDGPPAELAACRRELVDQPWTWLRQVHGAEIVVVAEAGQGAGREADGAVTATPGAPLAVTTADCAPVVLVATDAIGVVHAGWRGLVAGIIESAADRLRCYGGEPVSAVLGPCISPAAYEFGTDDLHLISDALGPTVQATTAWGTPALDMPAAVASACRLAGWPEPDGRPPCTSGDRWYSHRTRADTGRQATVAWIEPVGVR